MTRTDIADAIAQFDLDDPTLAEALDDAALVSGNYPYDERMDRKDYEKTLERLQLELVKLLAWLDDSGERVVVVFEGRDAAGKGGTISRFRQYLSPRRARIVALPKPSDRERGEWYFQRYVAQMPTSGEMVLFDRSWYNRGVVEPVMGFCSPEQTEVFLDETPRFEAMLKREGIHLFKFWLNIGQAMQCKRFHERRHDPMKSWKISPVDLKAIARWQEFSDAAVRMITETHTDKTPWAVIRANDKRRLRINAIRHVVGNIDYAGKDKKAIGDIDDRILGFGPKFLKAGL
ncbi:MAG: polyphosphate kinase 2 [Alphaproteobacteria bacterium]